MGWSTRQVAQLAGTTLRTVRHYHEIGLLEEPPRRANNYKEYEVHHLVRLLRIRRLSALGLSLGQIAALPVDILDPVAELDVIDADLAQTIEDLQRMRAEITAVREHGASTDLPAGFERVSSGLTDADRALITVYASVFADEAMNDLSEILPTQMSELDQQFADLAEDADVATRARLAVEMAPGLRAHYAEHPWLADPEPNSTARTKATLREAVDRAMTELYNMAQIEVVYRAHLLATDQTDDRLERIEESDGR
ncbi:MerR family transcriptional regulator [Brevibacterium aurantiacum]|uniref:HTH merR-type domain-containing protein n=1 Tax=Brevibacterium aurantiacum TaxID=273384 RepID=A0A2A3Z3A4_BREAU|nr:MerR family transcriptional regulator [Brevibacterium aurantiacum]PCC45855.1 hypothetical protein CIK64_14115 [Brevibacterium aurantiacum]